jgi:hypothetical protein
MLGVENGRKSSGVVAEPSSPNSIPLKHSRRIISFSGRVLQNSLGEFGISDHETAVKLYVGTVPVQHLLVPFRDLRSNTSSSSCKLRNAG